MGRELGRFVEERRKALQMTRRDLAEAADVSYPYLSQIETGEREPALKKLVPLAAALQVEVPELASLLSGQEWSSGSTQPRPSRRLHEATASERVDERLLYGLERRLREVPPLERLAVLNRLLALTIDELGERAPQG